MAGAERYKERFVPVKSKRVSPRALLTELKSFAFEQSPGFADGSVTGYEVTKDFYFRDQVPLSFFKRVGREYRSTKFTFGAYRVIPDGHGSYAYQLSTSVERSLPEIPPLLVPHISPKKLKACSKGDPAKTGTVREMLSTALNISDFESDEISIQNAYTLSYMGRTLVNRDADAFTLDAEGDFINIPTIESDNNDDSMFVHATIDHERIDPVDGVLNSTNFWQLVEPLGVRMEIDTFNAGARAMRTIMSALRTGEVF